MTMQTVTIQIPQTLYQRVARTATLTQQSLPEILLQTIRGNLPPALEDIPVEFQADLLPLLSFSDEDLWALARSPLEAQQWQRHQMLLHNNTEAALTPAEAAELTSLRTAVDRYVFRKSFALALLKWHGHTLLRSIGRLTSPT